MTAVMKIRAKLRKRVRSETWITMSIRDLEERMRPT
jgi:hypothetical protein